MALSRNRRDSNLIWPGFVDAVTTLLMVLMFVLTIFTVMQSVLQEQITVRDDELSSLNQQVSALSEALGMERRRAGDLQTEVGSLQASLSAAMARGQEQDGVIAQLRTDIATRNTELTAANERITSFEAQVAALITARDQIGTQLRDLQDNQRQLISDAEALRLALASARTEVDQVTEAARLDAARREALEALVAELRGKSESAEAELASTRTALDAKEVAALADAAALAALRKQLEGSDSELTAMALALEAERKRAEETLTLLAAARTAAAQTAGTASAKNAALAVAQTALLAEQEKVLASAREMELLNQQLTQLRSQLGTLQSVLDEAETARAATNVQLDSLGRDLNAALAQVAAEQRARAALEEAERLRLEAENQDLERFRSEFFGQLSSLLAGRDGVRVVGDRFVFSSEVLFRPGSADLSPEGQAQIGAVTVLLNEIRQQIPPGIDWIIRVDGHTDNTPLSGAGAFRDNWELSQARALSVVRYMQNDLGFPPDRLAATGFGEYRPVAPGDSEAARAQNRRIELKLTER
ncbi:peptidoglycan -binding protein [Xinfangfangia sp. D13-10-4-6]|uniref:peptidoglycan -binding protein n=1 Tax=Pseudogemmobacter hezensis TaxID=2737662 RepID=UPI001558270D|nr:peptidoglycan -binding protein [Pseudogemmobacter hezensis]NPD14441.1 peptidoglycan -binding protein [Pseudogemmobacter hezensis]